MKTFDAPEWMTAPFLTEGVSDSDFSCTGLAVHWDSSERPADALDAEDPSPEFKVAEYHTYTGISAARTAIDATASWLNQVLNWACLKGTESNLSRTAFQTKILNFGLKPKSSSSLWAILGRKLTNTANELNMEKGWLLGPTWSPKSRAILAVGISRR